MRFTARLSLVTMLVLASALFPLAAQIRDYVPIVKAVYNQETVSFLEKLSDSMKADGYDGAAAILKAYAKDGSGSGSGFVYVAKDGANYVVTNRHVVAQADSVTLEFEKPDGSQSVFKNCQIVAVGQDIDLALIALPATARPFAAGLGLVQTVPEDGAEVWTAGYPGDLEYNPTWQLGKGNVTNSSAKLPLLVDPAITVLIQHSAQIDHGNSGGPLLVPDKASPSGYKVVGINTWKDFDRQATNYSIPSPAVQAFVADTLAKVSAAANPQAPVLEARCRSFISASAKKDDAYREIAKYISYAYVAHDGEAVIKNVLSVAPTRVRNYIISAFVNESPIEGIRLAIAYKILSLIQSDAAQAALGFVAVDGNADAAGAAVPTRFTLAGKEISLTWQREHGVWNLSSYPLEAAKAAGKDGAKKSAGTSAATYDDSPYTILFDFGPDLALGSSNGTFWRVGMYYIPLTYVGIGSDIAWQSTTVATYTGSSESSMRLQIELAARAQLPIRFDNFAVIPYLTFMDGYDENMGGSLNNAGGNFFALEGGAQLGFGADPHLFLGAAVKYYVMSPANMSEGAALSLWLGLGF